MGIELVHDMGIITLLQDDDLETRERLGSQAVNQLKQRFWSIERANDYGH
jgi:hypothetical protein